MDASVKKGFPGTLKQILLGVVAFALGSSAAQAQVAGDFNGDGRADHSIVEVNRRSGVTRWRVIYNLATPVPRRSKNRYKDFRLRKPGDALIQGRFFYGGAFLPGIVFVKSLSEPLEWRLVAPGGGEFVFEYGNPGDNIPNQGDLDCDGITDITVLRKSGGEWHWFISRTATQDVVEVEFGNDDDRTYIHDMDGNGCDDLVTLSSNFKWSSRSLADPTVTQIDWGAPGDFPVLPQDLNGDTLPDYTVVRNDVSSEVALLRFSDSQTESRVIGPKSSIPAVGNYVGSKNFSNWLRSSGRMYLTQTNGTQTTTKVGKASFVYVRPDGTVVQPSDSGRFGSTGGGPIPGECAHPKFPDGGGGFLWKPVKEGGSHTRGGPTVLLDPKGGMHSTSLIIYGSDGAVVNEARLRYYNGNGGRDTWDPTKLASEMSHYAPLTVRAVFDDGTCEDRTIQKPTSRYD